MGTDYNYYIGPYAYLNVLNSPHYLLKPVKVIDLCKYPSNCPNSSDNFCPKCGIFSKDRKKTEVPSPWLEIPRKLEDVFVNIELDNTQYFLPNKHGIGFHFDDDSSEFVKKIEEFIQNDRLTLFKDKYCKHLTSLCSYNNILKLDFDVGLIHWCS